MTTWNSQQLEAITTRNKNILVSASAGAGKTTILVERMMRLIREEHYPIDSILAMTFTEAAASEMKKRLSFALAKDLEKETDPSEILYLKQQISKVQSSSISTIHSFCLSIVQEYFYVIGINRERTNNIMDDGAILQAKKTAREFVLNKEYAQQEESFLNLLWYFSTRPEDTTGLIECIESIVNEANAQTNPYDWISHFKDSYTISSVSQLPKSLLETFFAFLTTSTLLYEEKIDACLQTVFMDESFDDNKQKQLLLKKEAIGLVKEKLLTQAYEPTRLALIQALRLRISAHTTNDSYTAIKKTLDAQEKHLLALLYSEKDIVLHSQMCVPLIQKLADMCTSYLTQYEKIKEEMGCIDFNDMEHFALAILQANNASVSKEYITRFNEVMVDEFQDTNPVQDAIVSLVSKHNNTFRVGDIKQSIYGFRQANPQIMKNLMEQINENNQMIHLANNYRSKQMIVDFNNDLFHHLMNMQTLDSSYSKHDFVTTGVMHQKEDNLPIEFHAIFHNEFKEEHQLRISKHQIKASYIANQMIKLYNTGNYQWKDFCVLGRSNAVKLYMKEAFDACNIPYFIDTKSGFYESSSIEIISSALNVLIQPNDDISMVAILSSPLFHYSFDEIAQIKLKKGNLSFYEYLMNHPTKSFNEFYAIKEKIATSSIHELLQNLFELSDFYPTHTDAQERTNLDMLFDIAVDFEEEHHGGIEEFLVHIQQMKQAKTGEAIPIGSEEDIVRVMTIHQSKGLQFPTVFLFSSSTLSNIESRQSIICDSQLGLGMKNIYQKHRTSVVTPQRLAIDFKRKKESISEEMRTLYVATTRAQKQMFIVDCLKDEQDLNQPLTLSSFYDNKGYSTWILRHFSEFPTPYFKLVKINEYWDPLTLPAASNKISYSKKNYSYPIVVEEEFSASQKKAKDVLPNYQQINLRGMRYGTNMHKMVELLNGQTISTESIKQCAKNIYFTIKENDIQKIMFLYQNSFFKQLQNNSTLYYELPFIGELPEGQSFGFMDLVAMNEKEIVIIDFKTDVKDEKELIEAYHEQLSLYKKVMQQMYPNLDVVTYLYSFTNNSFIEC